LNQTIQKFKGKEESRL